MNKKNSLLEAHQSTKRYMPIVIIGVMLLILINFSSSVYTYLETSWNIAGGSTEILDIDYGNGFIWTCDYTNQKVQKYFPNGTYITSYGAGTPYNYGCGANDSHLVVNDQNPNYKLIIMNQAGSIAKNISRGMVSRGVDINDTALFLAEANKIDVIEVSSGNYLYNFSTAGQSGNIWGVTTNNTFIWASDRGTGIIYQYLMDGTYTGEFLNASNQTHTSYGTASNSTHLFVVGQTENKVFIYENLDVAGNLIINLVSPTNGSTLTNFTNNFTALYNSTPTGYNLVNATYYLWWANGTVYNKTHTIVLTGEEYNVSTVPFTINQFGNYVWNTYVCIGDGSPTNCSFASQNNTFTLNNYRVNSITYDASTIETSSETFSLNITLGEGVSLSNSLFYYNNISYATSITSNGFNRVINTTLTTPDVTTSTNYTLFWALTLNNGSAIYVNTSEYNQTVNNIGIDNCSTNTNAILNFSIFDEDSRTFLNNVTANTSTNIYVKVSGDFSGEVYTYYASSDTSNSVRVCLADALIASNNYRLDAELQIGADPYATEYYYIENYTLNTTVSPMNISLYLLPTARSQEFLITYKDRYYVPTSGALIQLTRQYLDLGQFLTVEILKTDNDGHTIGHFVLNDEVYTIFVIKDGVLQATFNNVRATCSNVATGDCKINLNAASSTLVPSSFINNLGVSYTESYNDTTRVYSFIFTTTDSSTKNLLLNISKYDAYNNETICTTSLASASGNLTCVIPAQYYNNSGFIRVYVDGELLLSKVITISPFDQATLLDSSRYILAFFMIITLPLIAGTSGIMTLVFFILGFIASGSLALIDWGYLGIGSIFWFIIAAGIIIFKISRRDR